MAHVDGIASVGQREGLHDAHIVRGGFEADLGAVTVTFLADKAEWRQVGGVVLACGRAHYARLGDIGVTGTAVQQHEGLFIFAGDRVFRQLRVDKLGALSIEHQVEYVSADFDPLRLRRGGLLLTGYGGSGRGGRSAYGGSGYADVLLSLCTGVNRLGGQAGAEQRWLAVIGLPVVPQQQQREGKNHPEDGTSDIHSAFTSRNGAKPRKCSGACQDMLGSVKSAYRFSSGTDANRQWPELGRDPPDTRGDSAICAARPASCRIVHHAFPTLRLRRPSKSA